MAESRRDLSQGPPIFVFSEQDAVDADAVVDFWLREDAMPDEVARQRVEDLHVVAVEEGEVVAVTTTALAYHEQLRMPMWAYRGFVGAAHRLTAIGLRMAIMGRDDLERRFVADEDTRGAGIIYEVQVEGLRRAYPEARWPRLDFTYIGDNELGDHVRVHYFPGALAPPPQGRT